MNKLAFVEIRNGRVVRIFRSDKAAANFGTETNGWDLIKRIPYEEAVGQIRLAVYRRAKHQCKWCGESVAFRQCQMHEVVPRGKGGEISVDNSIILCYDCHQGRKDSAHGNRKLQFGRKSQ